MCTKKGVECIVLCTLNLNLEGSDRSASMSQPIYPGGNDHNTTGYEAGWTPEQCTHCGKDLGLLGIKS